MKNTTPHRLCSILKVIVLSVVFLLFISISANAQVTIWSEDFSTNANNDIIGDDNNLPVGADWTTSCPTCNRTNEFRVEGNRFRVENTDEIATWTSEVITITGYTGVASTISIDMDDNQFDATDCITISYILDGGPKTQFPTNGNLCDDGADPTIASVTGLSGTTFQIIIDAITTNTNEDLHFDNISVTGTLPVVLINEPGSGNTLDFDGTNDYVDIGDVAIDGLSAVTVEAWIYPTSLRTNASPSGHNANEGAIIHKSGSSDDNIGLTVTTAGITFYIDNGSDNTLTGSAPLTNTWTHVAATYDGSNLIIYINGVLNATMVSVGSGNLINNTNNLRIGGGHIVSHEFSGRIDEVRVWQVAKTQAEIRADMCKKQLGSEANLAGYWRFDESSGTQLADHATTYHGTLTNMAPASDWVTSGAALGNTSTYLYTGAWGGEEIYLQGPEGDSLGVSVVTGNPDAVHIYNVDELPNVNTGIVGLGANNQYYGVFKAGGTAPTYTATYYYSENDAFQLGSYEPGMNTYIRDDNADITWADPSPTLNTVAKTLTMPAMSTEFILGNINIPLPIELISFEANINDDRVDIKWVTAAEINNDFFTVERSIDAKNWEEILVVAGAGNSNQLLEYFEADYEPIEGISYYRLKQTDFNGAYEYFNIVPVKYVVDNSGDGTISLYPSPASKGETVKIEFKNIFESELLVVLRDIQGKEFYSKVVINIEDGKLIGVPIETHIPSGVYLITATSENQMYSQKLIIK